ncbi:MAG: hypothetical protein NXI31_00565 [bacterium]|nr:hypothetical protein [bacterium]
MLTTTLAALACLAPQDPPTGIFMEQATVVQDPTASNPNELRYVPQGPGPVNPILFGQLLPQFYRNQMLPTVGTNVELSAFSAGGDRIPCNETTGEADIEFSLVQWGFLKFVVGGITNNSDPQYVGELNGPGGVEADIFTYWHPGSEIPDDYVDVVEKARDGLGMGLNRISGMDHVLAGLVLTDEIADDAEELSQRIYFTISPATLAAYDLTAWFYDESGVQQDEHSATILMIERDGSTWLPPVVFKRYDELGLDPTDEISALCVDEHSHRILVGTRTARRELWIANFGPDFAYDQGYRGEYLAPGGGSFARGPLKLNTGESVEAACSGDPGDDTTDFEELFHHRTGMPQGIKNTPRQDYEVAVSRAYDQTTRTDLVDIFVGNLRTIPGNANFVTVVYYIDDRPVGVDLVDPQVTTILKHSESVPTFLPPLEWNVRVEVFSGTNRYPSLTYAILL